MRRFLDHQKIAFDPEAIEILVRAFNDCWNAVRQSGADMNEESTRNTLARCIIDAALEGELDPQRLAQFAALHLAQATGDPAIKKAAAR